MNGSPRLPTGPEVKCGKSAVYRKHESGIILYDPEKEFDAPDGPWKPCYLLKLDSPLAKKLLEPPTPAIDLSRIVANAKTINLASAEMLKDLEV